MFLHTKTSSLRRTSSNGLAASALLLAVAALCSCKHEAIGYERPPQVVEVAAASTSDKARDIVLTGTLEAERSWALSFATPGTVEQVLVREGESVKRGQFLARLSARSYQDALGIASSKARQAEDAYRRLEPMYRNQTLPEIKMVEIESSREQARLAVSMAQKAVADTVLRAPESGIISRRVAEPGMNLAPGLPAFTLVQTHNMLATASLPEKQIARVKLGDPARVSVEALQKTFEGKVTEVGITADILTRSFPVKVAIPNADGALRVGMVAEVRLPHKEAGKAIVVATQAVHVDGSGNNHVFVLGPASRVQRRKVRVLGFVNEGTAIEEGVAVGEFVITSDTPMLSDGMLVRTRDQAPHTPASGDLAEGDAGIGTSDDGSGDAR